MKNFLYLMSYQVHAFIVNCSAILSQIKIELVSFKFLTVI